MNGEKKERREGGKDGGMEGEERQEGKKKDKGNLEALYVFVGLGRDARVLYMLG